LSESNDRAEPRPHELKIMIIELRGDHNVLKERVQTNVGDIDDIKVILSTFVTKESFDFYARAFWILAGAVGSGLVGSIFYVITTSR
jgi:hypothetical protein